MAQVEEENVTTFWTTVCPKSTWQTSAVVKGLLSVSNTVSLWECFDEMVELQQLLLFFTFIFSFFWKCPETCPLIQGAWFSCSKYFWRLHCWGEALSTHDTEQTYRDCREPCNVSWTRCNLLSFLLTSDVLSVPFLKNYCNGIHFVVIVFLARVYLWAYQNYDQDKCAMWASGVGRNRSKITGRPFMNQDEFWILTRSHQMYLIVTYSLIGFLWIWEKWFIMPSAQLNFSAKLICICSCFLELSSPPQLYLRPSGITFS